MVLEWFISAYISWHLALLALFWAYIGQLDNHIGWVTLINFASIYSKKQSTNPWNFHERNIENWWAWKTQLLWVATFWFIFQKMLLLHHSLVKIYRLAWMGLNFDDYCGFQLKRTHANQYKHHCRMKLKKIQPKNDSYEFSFQNTGLVIITVTWSMSKSVCNWWMW